MNFQVNAQFLNRCFKGRELNFQLLESQLDLDSGHVFLIRDCLVTWQNNDKLTLLVLLYLIHSINQGSICVVVEGVQFKKFLQQHTEQSPTEVLKVDWQNLMIDDEPAICVEGNRLYFNKYWQAEKQLDMALKALLNNYSGRLLSAKEVNRAAHEVVNDLTFDGIENKQILAVVTSLLQPFSIISGGPGTGKTTIMSSVLRGLLKSGYAVADVILAAPTGRAAQRMTESMHDVIQNSLNQLSDFDHELLKTEAFTIHRLLGAHPHKGGFRFGIHHQLTAKVIIVDEVSMVDLMLMKQLLQAIPHNCRVILLGDQYQLPSVSSGAVLADMLPPATESGAISQAMMQQLTEALTGFNSAPIIQAGLTVTHTSKTLTDRYTILEVSKRSNARITNVSELVKAGQANTVLEADEWNRLAASGLQTYLSADNEGVYHLPLWADQHSWLQFCLQWVQHQYFVANKGFKSAVYALKHFKSNELNSHRKVLDIIFSAINSNRVLTLVNQSWVGSNFLNSHISEMMCQNLEVIGYGHQFHGAVIMVKRNDKDLKLFNGDVGVVLLNENDQLQLIVKSHSDYRAHSLHVIPEHVAAYAMTVHKSQGSEFNHVLMPLPLNNKHRLLTREIIYTGMTRAKKSVMIYGSEEVIKKAIETQTTRYSGLRFWYNQNQ